MIAIASDRAIEVPEAQIDILGRIIARAASPKERRAGGWLVSISDSGTEDTQRIEARERTWKAAVTGGDQRRFYGLLRERGLNPHQFRAGLGECTVCDWTAIPDWARELLEMTASFGDGPEVAPFCVGDLTGGTTPDPRISPLAKWLYNSAFSPFLQPAASQLRRAVQKSSAAISPGAERDMLTQLARRWNATSVQTFSADATLEDVLAATPFHADCTVFGAYLGTGSVRLEHWITLWLAYPVLARLMAVVRQNWRGAVAEFLERLSCDLPTLNLAFGETSKLGRLEEYQADAGDQHGGGRSVTRLRFENGASIFYKPKDLGIAGRFEQVIELLNGSGRLALEVPAMVARPGYAWQAKVQRLTCGNQTAVSRYYQRIGMLARLLQLLNASDCHHENVIASGEQPILVDAEALLAPVARSGNHSTASEQQVHRMHLDSPVISALITCKAMSEPGRKAPDLSAITLAGRYPSPHKNAVFRLDSEGRGRFAFDYGELEVDSATPELDGQRTGWAQHVGHILAGYRSMGERIRECTDRLLAPEGPLLSASDCLIRYVYRQTSVYARVLSASLEPACLRDAIAREIVLERLWKAHLEHPGPTAIIESEVNSLRDLDIPLFTSNPGSDALLFADGRKVPGYFDDSVLALVTQRLQGLGQTPLDAELDLLKAALFVLDPEVLPPAPVASVGPHPAEGHSRFLKTAIIIGDTIIDAAVRHTPDDWAWLGLYFVPEFGVWQFGCLPGDVFSGTLGIAAVLADLAVTSRRSYFADAARQAILAAKERVRDTGGHPLFSAYKGFRYAAARIGTALKDAGLQHLADEMPRSELASGAHNRLCVSKWLDSIPTAEEFRALDRLRRGQPAETSAVLLGSKGSLLARLEAALYSADARCGASDELMRFLDRPPVTSLDRLEQTDAALCAYRVFENSELLDRARANAALLADAYQRTGTWFPDRLAPDRFLLSAVNGIAAVAHVFLRLHDPVGIRSIRVLE